MSNILFSKFISFGSAQIISAVSLFGLVVIQTNNLTLYDYGLVALIQLLSEVVKSVAVQWNAIGLVRFFPEQKEESKGKIFSYVLVLSIFALLISGSIAYIILSYQFETSPLIYIVCVGYIFIKCVTLLFLELHRISDNKGQYLLSVIAGNAAILGFTYFLTSNNSTFEVAIIAMALGQFLQFVISGYKVNFKFSLDYAKKITVGYFNYTVPLVVSSILTLVVVRFDRFYITTFLSLEDFAIYSAVANLVYGLMAIIFSVIVTVYYPELIRSISDRCKLCTHQLVYIKLVVFGGLSLMALLIANESYVIPVILGEEYVIKSSGVFVLLVICSFFYNVNEHVLKHPFHFSKQTNHLIVGLIIGLVCNIFIMSLLARFFGLLGVVASVAISQVFVAIYYISKARAVGFPVPFPSQFPFLVQCGILLFVIVRYSMSLISEHSILSIVIINFACIVLYLFFLYIFDFFNLKSIIRSKLL